MTQYTYPVISETFVPSLERVWDRYNSLMILYYYNIIIFLSFTSFHLRLDREISLKIIICWKVMFATEINLFQTILWWGHHLALLSRVVQGGVSGAGLFRGLKPRYKLNSSGACWLQAVGKWMNSHPDRHVHRFFSLAWAHFLLKFVIFLILE